MSITFLTTTSHGTWLPGDLRGYVRKGITLPGDPKLLELSRQLLKRDPVYFNDRERDALFDSLVDACKEFGYRLSDVAVEAWHLHWIVWHGDDEIKTMAGRLKTRMRQASPAAASGPKAIAASHCTTTRPSKQRRPTLPGTRVAA
jgi:hypothetical protein